MMKKKFNKEIKSFEKIFSILLTVLIVAVFGGLVAIGVFYLNYSSGMNLNQAILSSGAVSGILSIFLKNYFERKE